MPTSTDLGPPLRPTHAEKDSKGEWLGFEGRLALYPITTVFGGIFIFSVLYSFRGAAIFPTAPLCLVPGAFVTFVVVTLVNKKPPGYLIDWLDTKLGRASIEQRPAASPHPLSDD
jgi:hypothetical protein